MAIRANVGENPINLLIATDNVLYELATGIDRYHVGACNINNNSTTLTVEIAIFISPDLTSASGKQVDSLTLGPEDELDINAIIGQGYTENVIVTVDNPAVGTITVTQYTGGS